MQSFQKILGAALVLVPAQAWAHHFMDNQLPRTFAQGFLSGLGHPIIGIDHLAFIFAAGFLLALFAHGMWGILALVAGSLLGAATHLTGQSLPGAEVGVALSVILVGGLVMARREIKLGWLVAGLTLAGELHGYAYAELIFGAEPAPLAAYLAGFSVIQFGVAAAAFFAHRRLAAMKDSWVPAVSSVLGGAASAIGLFSLLS